MCSNIFQPSTDMGFLHVLKYIFFIWQGPMLIVSSEGGVNIEEIAERNPDAIIKIPVDISVGFSLDMGKGAAVKMGIPPSKFVLI